MVRIVNLVSIFTKNEYGYSSNIVKAILNVISYGCNSNPHKYGCDMR